jgi:hypothetical protein
MSGAIPPLPQYAFMAWCLVKAQGKLYLYLVLLIKVIYFSVESLGVLKHIQDAILLASCCLQAKMFVQIKH